ncbi:MAG: 30S ribosomal protein S12 methylthiotransferase RimO [Candidatus Riflebacteria bacterium]|nr:30S ribosomal protein S12 methylthiotransferase RimO [Candidatus Riflebacteria bacterium]
MKFHLISLGCPKNTVDSEKLIGNLVSRGLVFSQNIADSELLLINTCGFIKDAKEESLGKIMEVLQLKKDNPKLKVIAFGCLIKRYFDTIKAEIPEIDHVFTFFTGSELDDFIKKPKKAKEVDSQEICGSSIRHLTPPHFGFLKIAEGCDNRCAYCAIPNIRGPFKSHPINKLLLETQNLVDSGAREIILIAQDTTNYGRDIAQKSLLPDLIKEISTFSAIKWIRLQYLHPKRLSPSVIDELFSIPKVLPYFDIPIQHVSDRLLTLMNRGVTKTHLSKLISHIRKNFSEGIIRTTIIIGFPGETRSDFDELISFIERRPFDRLGAFPYSSEEGTTAAKIHPKVPRNIKKERLDELMTLQGLIASERNQKLVGKTFELIVDSVEKDIIHGRTYGDSPEIDLGTSLPNDKQSKPGDFIKVKITAADSYDLTAEKVE